MPDLGESIRGYIDGAAPAIELDEVQRGVDTVEHPGDSRGRRRRGARWLAVAAVVVVVAAGLASSRLSDTRDVAAGPDPTGTLPAPATGGDGSSPVPSSPWPWPWIALGTKEEAPAPVVPARWKVLDYGRFRFAVPPDWAVPISRSCAQPAPGLVLVSNGAETARCNPVEPALPTSLLSIEPWADDGAPGATVQVGTMWALRVDEPRCETCLARYRFENGYEVSVGGPDADRILATFTDSGARRALQAGTDLDTSGWREVVFEGVALRVPFLWTTRDLRPGPGATQSPRNGFFNPGLCGATFPHVEPALLFLGSSEIRPPCGGAPIALDLEPADGIWIRAITDEEAAAYTDAESPTFHGGIGRGQANGLDITFVGADRPPGPVLDLLVRRGSTTVAISVGAGLDVSTARAIVRSMRAA